jgi:hypothetical protein
MTKPRLHTGAFVEDPRGRTQLPTPHPNNDDGPGRGLSASNERPELSLRIFRSHPDDNFTIIPNAALRDERLSYTARGILAELLTHSDGWETNADALWRQAQKQRDTKTGEGREGIRAAFAELEEHGYLVRRRIQGERGRFTTVLELYDASRDRRTDDRTSEGHASADQTSASRTSLRSTNTRSTKEEETKQEDSATLANARVAAAAASARDDGDDQDEQLRKLYEAVDGLSEENLRNRLLAFERKRPRIYRECRQAAIEQIKESSPDQLKSKDAGVLTDRLSFKYALQHYAPDWPAWLLRSPVKR